MINGTMDTLYHFQPSNGSEVLMQAIYTLASELADVFGYIYPQPT